MGLVNRMRVPGCRCTLGVWILVLGAALAAGPARSSGLQVAPVLLDFAPTQRALAIWLSNTSKRPIHAQARLQAWSQSVEGEVLSPTQELVASPPMVEIAPGQSQVVRIVRMNTSQPLAEMAFRLLVDELPGLTSPSTAFDQQTRGLQFLFRYSIPVFVASQEAVQLQNRGSEQQVSNGLRVSLNMTDRGAANLKMQNTSARRIKLSDLSYVEKDGTSHLLQRGLFGYVLAGQVHTWAVPSLSLSDGDHGQLRARVNEDSDEVVLPRTNR